MMNINNPQAPMAHASNNRRALDHKSTALRLVTCRPEKPNDLDLWTNVLNTVNLDSLYRDLKGHQFEPRQHQNWEEMIDCILDNR